MAGLHIDYRTKPSVHLQRTDIACVCRPTHSPHALLQFLAWHMACRMHASLQILPCIMQHLIMDTSIQSPRRCSIANVCCCAERFHPKGFRHAQMAEHGALGTGEYSNCLFCYTIRCMAVRDWGCSLVRHACRCRTSCPSIIRVLVHHDLLDPPLRVILCCHPEWCKHVDC